MDEVTKMVQENSQDIKIAGNVGGKGAVKCVGGGGLSWLLMFVDVVSGVASGGFPGPDHSRPV